MEPMKPLKPMQPLTKLEQWWPQGLDDPSATGAQDGMRYAFFADKKLLLIERQGKLQKFGTGDHLIRGVSQISRDRAPVFQSERGPLKLDDLQKLAS
jgi:hypothetical protein